MSKITKSSLASIILLILFLAIFAQEEKWQKLNEKTLALANQEKFTEAEKTAKEALDVAKKSFDVAHPLLAVSLYHLAMIYHNQNKYYPAESFYKEAQATLEKAIEEKKEFNESGTIDLSELIELKELGVDILTSSAQLHVSQKQYEKAEALLDKALILAKECTGLEGFKVAQCYDYLAGFYQAQGKYPESLDYYKKALEIWRRAYADWVLVDPDSLEAAIMKMLGSNENSTAQMHKLSREIAFGYATTLRNLAGFYIERKMPSEAAALYIKALVTIEEFGDESKEYATLLNNLAILYVHQENYSEAETLFLDSLDISKKIYGSENPALAPLLGNIAELYRKMGKTKKAEKFEKRADKILTKNKKQE